MLNFWVRRDGQEDWQPVPAEGAVLEEDTYTIVARSPQPHFTITVEVRQRPLGPQNQGPNTGTTPPQVQTRSVRTNDEGIGIILPASRLTPGFWELHCRDAGGADGGVQHPHHPAQPSVGPSFTGRTGPHSLFLAGCRPAFPALDDSVFRPLSRPSRQRCGATRRRAASRLPSASVLGSNKHPTGPVAGRPPLNLAVSRTHPAKAVAHLATQRPHFRQRCRATARGGLSFARSARRDPSPPLLPGKGSPAICAQPLRSAPTRSRDGRVAIAHLLPFPTTPS